MKVYRLIQAPNKEAFEKEMSRLINDGYEAYGLLIAIPRKATQNDMFSDAALSGEELLNYFQGMTKDVDTIL